MLTGLTVLTAERMDTVDVIDGDVQTALPVNLVNNLNSQQGQQRPPSIQSTLSKTPRSRRRRSEPTATQRAHQQPSENCGATQPKYPKFWLGLFYLRWVTTIADRQLNR